MKILPLQDNLSKVKAVEDAVQQLLRFPDEAQQLAVSTMQKRRELRRRQVVKSREAEAEKLKERRRATDPNEAKCRGRKEPEKTDSEEIPKQCSIDFLI
jgi:hypothetical protein